MGTNRQCGFSITELIIAIAIVGILSVVAYPSYLDHVKRSNRNDGKAALARVANDLERFFATNGTYTTDTRQTSLEFDGKKALSDDGNYVVAIAAGPTRDIATSYLLTAYAHGPQVSDEECKQLTLDSAGRRTPDPSTSRCW